MMMKNENRHGNSAIAKTIASAIAWAIAFVFICLTIGPTADLQAAERPNIVMLLADDLGWKDVGCYGGPVKTPAIDGLAERGTRFTQFYSGCAVCSPSRATLMTGRHHIRTGVYSWIHDPSQNSHLRLRETTLAELLKQHGYATAHVGKWHLGLPTADRDKPTPGQHGFDYWFATWNNAEPSHRNPRNFIRNGKPVGELKGYACQLVADEAIQWLESRAGSEAAAAPFFLNVWFHEPHQRIAAPPELTAKYGAAKSQAAIYSATIHNTDLAIARLLKAIEMQVGLDNTLIIYASDNGSYRDDRTGGLRGRKGVNWEGGIRVPGIFVWPGRVIAGQVQDEPAGLVDVVPTICGLLELPLPPLPLDGANLSTLLRKREKASSDLFSRHQPLFWHLQKSKPIVAIRDGDFSLVAERDFELSTHNMFQESWIPTLKNGGYRNYQLFNLRTDPKQTKNLAADEPERLAKLKAKLLDISQSVLSDGADWHLGMESAWEPAKK